MWQEGWNKSAREKGKKAERGDRRRLRYWSFAQWLGSGCVGRLSGSVFKDYFHIRMRWWGSVKGGSESSMGSTRRVPLITSSWSPYANSLSKSSEVAAPAKAGPPLVWAPLASVLTVMSPYVRLMSPSLRMRSESSSFSWHSFCRKKKHKLFKETQQIWGKKDVTLALHSYWMKLCSTNTIIILSHALCFLIHPMRQWKLKMKTEPLIHDRFPSGNMGFKKNKKTTQFSQK